MRKLLLWVLKVQQILSLHNEIQSSENPEETRHEKIEEYREKFANPYVAASTGMVDDVIDPRETRIKLIQALEMLHNKKEESPQRNMVIYHCRINF